MIAICFYTSDSFEELKRVADDKKTLSDTYADWVAEFSKTIAGLKDPGLDVVPVNINIEELCKWCKKNKLKNTSSGRSRYVAEITNSKFSSFSD